MKESKIPALYKEDLIDFLTSIGENEAIANSQRNCAICSRVITIEDIQIIVPRANKKFEYICNDSDCIFKYNNPPKEIQK